VVFDGSTASDCSTGGGSNAVLCYSNGATWTATGGATTCTGTSGQLLTANGTSSNCVGRTTGTGILTALGINIGSAGAPVLFNGALGTPSSGVATNLTGTASALNIGGNAATATNLASYPTLCSGGQFSQGLSSASNNCGTPISGLTTNVISKATSATAIGNSSITDNGTTVTTPEPFSAASISAGSVPTSSVCAPGTAGMLCFNEGTTPTGTFSAVGVMWPNSTGHRWNMINGTVNDIVVGVATTDSFTNKTFDTGATGNVFKIAGTAISAVSGTGAVCLLAGSACPGVAVVAPSGYGYISPMPTPSGDYTNALTARSGTAGYVGAFFLPAGATVTKAHVYVETGQAGSTAYIGLYDGQCGTLLASSSAASTSSSSVLSFTVSSTVVAAGYYYWYLADSNSSVIFGSASIGTNGGSVYNNGTHPQFGLAANAVSGGSLPSSCVTITGGSLGGIPALVFDN
jgi:hypothetical protein